MAPRLEDETGQNTPNGFRRISASKQVHRNLEISDAIVFRGRQLPGPHVDLHGRNNKSRHFKRGVAPLPYLDELILCDAIIDLNVMRSLPGDRGLPPIFRAAGRQIIMAQEEPCLDVYKRQDWSGLRPPPCT